jgi:hypothetical protein
MGSRYFGEMTDVKAQELSLDEWHELLEPYGWADITVTTPAVRFHVPAPLLEYEIRVILKPGRQISQDEWTERSHLLEQARQAVGAVQAKGYALHDAPDIEFGGHYMYPVDIGAPLWQAEASLRFRVGNRR